ncbi:MAG: peptide ABC transporter substrate-binding protein [Chloroflexi bacterium]|nr:peptide ABC transporter substrate-binding protein [Chloroflexota bacterium]
MKKLRWQLLIVLVAIAAIVVLLISQKPTADGGAVAEPTEGGLYIEALVGQLSRLNPLLDNQNQVDRDVNRLIFSSLVRFDANGNPQPDLAQTWGISLDGTVYNVSLQPEAIWHDGEAVIAEDILFTIELMRNPELPIAPDIQELWASIEVVVFDEHNLQFRLSEPFAPFLDYLTFGIVPKHILEGLSGPEIMNAQFNLEPIGSGPYRFEQLLVEADQIQGVVLEVFEEYFKPRPFIDRVVFRYFDSSEAALEAYHQGEVLGISPVSNDILDEVLSSSNINVYSSRLPKLSLVLLNLDDPEVAYFQDVVVRKALMGSLNRQWMIGQIFGGQAVLADGPIMPGSWAYYPDTEQVNFDPDSAEASLRAAGYVIPAEGGEVRGKDGVLLSFDLAHPDTQSHTELAQVIQNDWERIGVRVNLIALPYETLVSDYLEPRRYEAVLVDFDLGNSPDPDPYPFWHQAEANSGQNYSRWDDRRASEYLERARVSFDHSNRVRLYRNFQIHFSRELPAIMLFYPIYNYAVSEQVQGVSMGPLFDPSDRFATIDEWFLVARGRVEEEIDLTPTP